MKPRILLPLLFTASAALAQNPPAAGTPPAGAPPANQFGTRPTAANDTSLRPLSPEEIPPNLNFYAVNPLYKEGVPLGWAKERIEEKIDRGTVAIVTEDKKVYLSWRLLKSDPQNVTFNVYRSTAGGAATKLNPQPIAQTTDFVDTNAPLDRENTWSVRPFVNGREVEEPVRVTHAANPPAQNYRAIKLKEDVIGVSMTGIGDLNGDGVYDFVLKWGGSGKDPGQVARPSVSTYKFDAYDGKTGQFLWRHDLGFNMDAGTWWTPFVVRDLDGDNKAEVCFRAKPYAATLAEASEGARKGNALDGPEWLMIIDGSTGKEIDKADWIELQSVQHWGDNTGNRASRHLMGVAYLDGKTPAVLAIRGTYGVMKIDAWTLENKKLKKIWRWTNERAPFIFQGQGAHGLQVADTDGDGNDEIFNGAIKVSNDGRSLWSTGLGHGDRMYVTDIDPSRPGLEVIYICEDPQPQLGLNIRDAKSGDLLWGARDPNLDNAIDQVMVGDIDPKYPGMEVWINKGLKHLYFTAKGEPIPGTPPTTSDLVWWDGDLLREQLGGGGGGGGGRGRGGRGAADGAPVAGQGRGAAAGAPAPGAPAVAGQAVTAAPGEGGGRGGAGGGANRFVGKWKDGALAPIAGASFVGSVQQIADISGDWREEIVTFTNGELRIYSTNIPAKDRRVSLIQDPIYRHDVTTRTMGYNHVPQVSYYLGEK